MNCCTYKIYLEALAFVRGKTHFIRKSTSGTFHLLDFSLLARSKLMFLTHYKFLGFDVD